MLSRETLFDVLLLAIERFDSPESSMPGLPASILEVVDSFGFATLILEIEESLGIQVDFESVELDRLANTKELVSFFQSRLKVPSEIDQSKTAVSPGGSLIITNNQAPAEPELK